jgi:serine/threonine protein kinase
MSEAQGAAALPIGTSIDGCVIEQVAELGRYSISYIAIENGRTMIVREFAPQAYSVRDGLSLRATEPEDRNALRWWLRSFIDQSQLLGRLKQPALPNIHRVFEANGTAYAVSDPVAGEALEALLDREGTIEEAQLRPILKSLLDGLERAHAAGLLHRDVRPRNVVIRSDGSAVLVDFAVLRAPVRLKSGLLAGAGVAPYSAPEERSANGNFGPWTDLYAVGALAYRAISGIDPPSAQERRNGAVLLPAMQATRVRASDALLTSIDWALMLQPEARPQTVADLRAALSSVELPEMAPLPLAASPARKAGTARFAVPVILLALAGLAYWWFVAKNPPAESRAAQVASNPASAPSATTSPVNTAVPESASSSSATTLTGAGTSAEASGLDRLALDLMSKDRKAQDAAAQKLQEQREKDERDRKAREAIEKQAKNNPEDPGDKLAAKVAEKPAKVVQPIPMPVEDDAAAARTRQLEAEIARLKSERAAQPVDAEASKAAREKLERDKAIELQAERDRQAPIIARAKKTCRIPAPSLSTAGNLTYETAMRVPGAERVGAAIRLPPITTSDGETRQFEITSDSCARLVN